jgi:hypothetical protein
VAPFFLEEKKGVKPKEEEKEEEEEENRKREGEDFRAILVRRLWKCIGGVIALAAAAGSADDSVSHGDLRKGSRRFLPPPNYEGGLRCLLPHAATASYTTRCRRRLGCTLSYDKAPPEEHKHFWACPTSDEREELSKERGKGSREDPMTKEEEKTLERKHNKKDFNRPSLTMDNSPSFSTFLASSSGQFVEHPHWLLAHFLLYTGLLRLLFVRGRSWQSGRALKPFPPLRLPLLQKKFAAEEMFDRRRHLLRCPLSTTPRPP